MANEATLSKLLELTGRMDERLQAVQVGQSELERKIDIYAEQQSALAARVSILEAREPSLDQFRDSLHGLRNTIHDIELRLQLATQAAERGESRWSNIFSSGWAIAQGIAIVWILYKIGLNP